MKLPRIIARVVALAVAAVWLLPHSVLACPVCYGSPEAPMTKGMNMGIAFMLGVTGVVLSGFIAFIVYLVRRGRLYSNGTQIQNESLDNEWMDGKEKVR